MPSRLPVARVRPAWARYASVVLVVALATLITWLLPPIAEHTPFMFFFAATAVAAVFGGAGPGALAIAGSLLIVGYAVWPTGPNNAPHLTNQIAFLTTSGVIVFLADRLGRSSRRERAQREWSEVSLRSIGDAVIVTDVEGRVLTMNSLAESLTGWRESEADQELISKVFQIVNEQTRAPVENPIAQVCREGRVVGLANHTVLLARDGRDIPIDDSGAPIRSEDGRVVGAVLVFRDVTDRRGVERQNAALLAEAQAVNRAKDEFLAVLSHELRTPLTAILGWAQVLRGVELPDGGRQSIDAIERNALRQSHLIGDVLDVSRIVARKLSLDLALVDVAEVVEAAIETFRPLIGDKRLGLHVDVSSGSTVLGDSQRLQQVVSNLLSNAVKFTPPGGRVEVTAECEGTVCAITVSDTGAGISKDFLPLVFERFSQEESGSSRRYGGLGLGLTIVRHIVEMHGGTVSVSSDGPGRGASFTVQLAIATESANPIAPRRRSATLREAPRLDGLRLLAVDDEPDARGFVFEALRRVGADVRIASSAAEALATLKDFQADVLITDLEMPGEDGFELLRRVREAGYEMPAIALTAHSSLQDRTRVLAAGFQLHVPKPVDVAELQRFVASVSPRTRSASE